MINNRILAAVLLVVGAILLYFAYHSSQSLGDQVAESLTGRFSDPTTWYLAMGAAFSVAGAGLLVIGKSVKH